MIKQHCIVVVTASWVFLGDVTDLPEQGIIRIENAFNIRQWGTTKGLGEIALKGPTSSTVLDAYGVVELARTSEVFRIACSYKS